ncbi:MAG: ATP-binding protein, partial [Byssovorax sp.]
MLRHLKLEGVGPAPEMALDFSERLNVLTGDNGLGKSFLLDIAWWVLTRTWAGNPALPRPDSEQPAIAYVVRGKTGDAEPVTSAYNFEAQSWPLPAKRPPMPGLV